MFHQPHVPDRGELIRHAAVMEINTIDERFRTLRHDNRSLQREKGVLIAKIEELNTEIRELQGTISVLQTQVDAYVNLKEGYKASQREIGVLNGKLRVKDKIIDGLRAVLPLPNNGETMNKDQCLALIIKLLETPIEHLGYV